MKKSKKIIIAVSIICILIICLIILFLYNKKSSENISETDIIIPEETKLILNCVSRVDLNPVVPVSFATPCSIYYYYDQEGNLLKSWQKNEEILGSSFVKNGENLFYLFRNQIFIANKNSSKTSKNPLGELEKLGEYNNGFIQSGFIKDKNIGYSCMNLGTYIEGSNDYYFIINFFNDEKNYNIKVPYHLQNISYDAERETFVFVPSDSEFEDCSHFRYLEAKYNKEKDEFVLDDTLKSVELAREIMSWYAMVKNNTAYILEIKVPDSCTEEEKRNWTYSEIVLCIVNLENYEFDELTIKKKYKNASNGFGIVTGSPQTPFSEVDGKLYFFTVDNEVWIIEDENNIEVKKMPYLFKGSLDATNPLYMEYVNEDECNFMNTLLRIEKNGDIYLLNVYPDGFLVVRKLLDDGEYEEIIRIKNPLKRDDISINNFTIIE